MTFIQSDRKQKIQTIYKSDKLLFFFKQKIILVDINYTTIIMLKKSRKLENI